MSSASRPSVLFPWFKDVSSLKGVGPRLKLLLEKLTGPRIRDLLMHLPSGVVERVLVDNLADLRAGTLALFEADVINHQPNPRPRSPYKVVLGDDSGYITLVFFNARPDYIRRQLPEGERVIVSGQVDGYQDSVQITHPDMMMPKAKAEAIQRLEPVYPLTAGLSSKQLARFVAAALNSLEVLPEWQDHALLKRDELPPFLDALKRRHSPEEADIHYWRKQEMAEMPAATRLALDELLATQLALALVRRRTVTKAGRSIEGDGAKIAALTKALPYQLTGDQTSTIEAIFADMASEKAMLRLVQGDVGSGKTVVALMAAARAAEAGLQVALLAPTEILARQHQASFLELAEAGGLRIAYLSGRVKGKERAEILAALTQGQIDILIGTHAIIQDQVVFHDLGLAIVDEQHRFGVAQRLALSDKTTTGLDFLGLSATPIPRSLTLALYGDMDVSRIIEKPPGRQPIQTSVIADSRLDEVVNALQRKIQGGAQIYWVCPLVSDSETLDLTSAEDRFETLTQIFGDRVGLVHGQMKGEDKDKVMARFKAGDLSLLVATTVIEVGVDVPNATVMVIEGAERFGLAQLHQLRGRVGRGTGKSNCILIRSDKLSDIAKERLKVINQSEDGFYIAEEDLRLRGGGEVLGTRQSGMPDYSLVDMQSHAEWVSVARDDARRIVETDPELKSERGEALRILLYLFEQDAAVRYLRSG